MFLLHFANICTFIQPTSRRSRARRTRQSRQPTQPVPSDVLEKILKHHEDMSKSEESSDTSSTNSTPPQKRKEEDLDKPTLTMSVFRPAARPTPRNRVLNQPPSQQTLWSMPSRKKEPVAMEPPTKAKGIHLIAYNFTFLVLVGSA